MAVYVDSNGATWSIFYDSPSFGQIHPWQGLSVVYSDFPHLFAFTESGLHEIIDTYAVGHTPAKKAKPTMPENGPTVTYKTMTDARGVLWTLRTDSITPNRWTGYTNSSAYGIPKPATMTAATEALLRAQIAAYAVGHLLVPKPAPKPGGGGAQQPPVPPVVMPANKAGGGTAVALAAAFGLLTLFLGRRG